MRLTKTKEEHRKEREEYRAKHWRWYIKMQVRGPSYMLNGKRVWPYDVIPLLFHTEAAAYGYMMMRDGKLFMNDGSSDKGWGQKGRWKSASVEKVVLNNLSQASLEEC